MDIHVVSDFICPWCYIGKHQLQRALLSRPALDVALHWLPFELNPDMPAHGMERNAYMLQRFGTIDHSEAQARLRHAAAALGLAIDFAAIKRMPNTLAAHRLVRFAGEAAPQARLVEALFRAYFVHGKDIGDIVQLCAIAGEADLDAGTVRQYLEGTDGSDEVRQDEIMLRDMGVSGVPFTVIDRKFGLSGAAGEAAFGDALDKAAAPLEA